jgi:crossover junction endodeoxyribonuclease RuvC
MIVRRSRAEREEQAVRADPMEGKTVIGIDPGTNVLGYGVLQIVGGTPKCRVLGVVALGKFRNPYEKLRHIFERVSALVREYQPDEMAIEAPFYGDNVQSMLKLGRAQGVAMTAALVRDIPVFEYSPRRIKQAITGEGGASKEQVSALLQKILGVGTTPKELDATDGLAVALCHYYISSSPLGTTVGERRQAGGVSGGSNSWAAFVNNNPDKIK